MDWYVPAIADMPQRVVPASGDTVTIGSGVTALIIAPAGALLLLNVVFPLAVMDSQRLLITSGAAITAINMSVQNGGGAIKNPLTGLVINGYARWLWSAADAAWFRTG